MNATGLFIKAGYSYITKNEEGVSYCSNVEYDKYGNEFYNCITFWKNKNITVYREKTTKDNMSFYEAVEITFNVMQAIQKKIKELGW